MIKLSECEQTAEIESDLSLVLLDDTFFLNIFLKLILSSAEVMVHSAKYHKKIMPKIQKRIK